MSCKEYHEIPRGILQEGIELTVYAPSKFNKFLKYVQNTLLKILCRVETTFGAAVSTIIKHEILFQYFKHQMN